ncbi:hypothetical protein [Paenibacillus sp. 2003]|uniref:hypothetical protein n=1 Tax=Paenibacillus TaxID=44249 RepID=UPI00285BCABE|nr:hypothetical protein [Paenibacillus sp. 2003]MDR6717196.1 hypothetical protein [Paenibacillus sp. 2003]
MAQAVLEDSTKKMGVVIGTATEGGGLSQTLSTISDDLTSGLLISYRSSSLTRRSARTNVTRSFPGDRAPNATGLQGTGFAGSLFDLLRGPHWTLLAFANSVDPSLKNFTNNELHIHYILPSNVDGAAEGLIDTAGNAYRIYDVTSKELVLIRPDGYIAMRTSIDDTSSISNYLNSIYRAN